LEIVADRVDGLNRTQIEVKILIEHPLLMSFFFWLFLPVAAAGW